MYIETSSPRKPGDVARLVSQSFAPSAGGSCISFWYNMYGQTIDTLKVLVTVPGKLLTFRRYYIFKLCKKRKRPIRMYPLRKKFEKTSCNQFHVNWKSDFVHVAFLMVTNGGCHFGNLVSSKKWLSFGPLLS